MRQSMARLLRKLGMMEYKEKVQEARTHSHFSHCGGGSCWALFSQIIISTVQGILLVLYRRPISPRASQSDVFPVPIRIHLWQDSLSHNRPIRWFLVGGLISQTAFPSLFCLKKKSNMFGLTACYIESDPMISNETKRLISTCFAHYGSLNTGDR